MSGRRPDIERLFEARPLARYGGAAVLVLITVGVRFLLDPLMVGSLGMAFFYPAVILAAYWMGARPAILTAVLSTAAVLAFQASSSGSLTLTTVSWVILLLFVVTSALAIYLLSAIRGRLRSLSERTDQVEALAISQADLFRDHSERVTNHLQLIAAILELRAGAEAEPDAARVLTNAASRTLLISRMHREFAGGAGRTIDVRAFVQRLAAAATRGSGGHVEVRGEPLALPLEHATGIGLVLLDRLRASTGTAAIDIQPAGDQVAFRMAVERLLDTAPTSDSVLMLEAVAAQMHGRVEFDGDADLAVVRLTFPVSLQPPRAWTPLEQVLH